MSTKLNRLKKEILRFLLIGGIAVSIDGLVYFALVQFEICDPSWAKRISFAAGAIWAFFMNKLYTFQQYHFVFREPLIFVVVYIVGGLCNSIAHDLVFKFSGIKFLSFLIATGISTCTNFIGQKWIVFTFRDA